MDEETLQQIRDYLGYPEVQFDEAMLMLNRLLPPVLDRYRALCEIAAAVTEKGGEYWSQGDNVCLYCEARTQAGMTGLEDDAVRHTPDCIVTKARTLLGEGK